MKVFENIIKHPIAIAILLVGAANSISTVINAVRGDKA